jgi:nitrate reductase NapE component
MHAYTSQEAAVHTTDETNMFNATLNCSKGFTTDPTNGYCVPVCGEWSEFSQKTTLFFRIISVTLFAIHTVGNVIALGFSCYNYKIM